MASEYAWIITQDLAETEALGTCGPRDCSGGLAKMLSKGGGDKFRMKNDDGNVYYRGCIVGDYTGFEPLFDFGAPNGGAVDIEYWKDSQWRLL